MIRVLSPLLLVLAGAALPAAQISDLRLTVGLTPTSADSDFTLTSGNGSLSESDSDSADGRFRIAAGYVRSLGDIGVADPSGGFIFGAQATYDLIEDEDDDGDASVDTLGISALAGWAWVPVPGLHLEVAALLGVGSTTWDDETLGEEEVLSYEYGIRAGAWWTFANGVQLGLEAGYLVTVADGFEFDLGSGTELEVDYELSGFAVAAGLGYRL